MWYAVYKISDGSLQSLGQVVADDAALAAKGFDKISYASNPQQFDTEWNPATLVWDTKTVYRSSISVEDFFNLFTEQEFEDIVDARINGSPAVARKINAFIQRLNVVDGISLDSQRVITGVNLMEAAGLIGVGRAAVILG